MRVVPKKHYLTRDGGLAYVAECGCPLTPDAYTQAVGWILDEAGTVNPCSWSIIGQTYAMPQEAGTDLVQAIEPLDVDVFLWRDTGGQLKAALATLGPPPMPTLGHRRVRIYEGQFDDPKHKPADAGGAPPY